MDKSSPKLNVLCALSVSLLCASVAWAGTTWDGGGGDDNWGTGNNWNPDGSPSVGSTVDLTFSGSTRLTPNNNYGAWDDFRSMFFNSSSDFTVGGNEIDFFGKIENNGSGSATLDIIDFSFNSSNSELNPVSGDLTIGSSGTSGQQIFNNGNDVDVWGDNGHTLTLHTAIDGTGKLIVQQNSTVVINEGQTYTGNTEINAGEIQIGSSGDISGSSSIFVGNGGTTGVDAGLKITDTDGGTTFDNAMTINAGDGTSGNRALGSDNTSGRNTFDGNVTLNATTTLDTASGGEVEFGGVLSGTSGVKTSGDGTVVYTGANTYTGATEIEDGTLKLETGGSISDSSAVSVSSGATFDLNDQSETVGSIAGAGDVTLGSGTLTAGGDNTSTTVSGVISETGGLVKQGSGTLTLSGDNTFSGTTAIDAGTVAVASTRTTAGGTIFVGNGGTTGTDASLLIDDADGGTAVNESITVNNGNGNAGNRLIGSANTSGVNTFGGAVTLNGDATFEAASGGEVEFTGVVSGSNHIIKDGAGTVTLSGNNTFTDGVYIDEGTLALDHNSGAGTGTINVGAIGSSDAATLDIKSSGVTVANSIVVRDGTATRTVGSSHTSGSSTYSGTVSLDESVTLTAGSGGTTEFSGNFEDGLGAGTYGVAVNAAGGTVQFTGGTANSGTLDYTVQAGTLELGKTAGVNAIDSDITINGGATLRNNTANQIDDVKAVANAGTWDLNDNDETVGSVSGAGDITLGTGTLTTGGNNGSTEVSGVISETGALVKEGSGTLTLSGDNSYTGTTTINDGTLKLTTDGSSGQYTYSGGDIFINNGSTLELDGLGSGTDNRYQFNNDRTITFDSSGGGSIISGSSVGNIRYRSDNTFVTSGGAQNTISGTSGNGFNLINTSEQTFDVATGDDAVDLLVSVAISNGGSIVKDGAGTLALTAGNTFTGATTINAGTLQLGNGGTDGSLSTSSAISIGSGATFAINQTDTVTQGTEFSSAALSGAGGLEQAGSGTTVLNAANTYSGDTTISAGTLEIADTGSLGGGTYAGAIVNNGTLNYNSTTDQTLSGAISGSGVLQKNNTSTLTLSSANTYSGGSTLSAGTLVLGNNTAAGTGALTLSGGTLQGGGGQTYANAISVTDATSTDVITVGGNATFSGAVSGTGTLDFGGNASGQTAHRLRLSGDLSGFSGTLTHNNDGQLNYLDLQNQGTDTSNTRIFTSGDTGTAGDDSTGGIRILGDATIGELSGTGGRIGGWDSTLTIDQSTDTTYSGRLDNWRDAPFGSQRDLAIIKAGTGTLTLDGDNTFTQGLDIQNGTVVLNHENAAGTAAIDLGNTNGSDSATLAIGSAGVDVSEDITVNTGSTGTKTIRAAVGAGVATFSGDVTMNDGVTLTADAGGTLEMDGNIANGGNQLLATGDGINQIDGVISGTGTLLKQGTGDLNLTAANTFTGDVFLDSGKLIVTDTSGDAMDAASIRIGADSPNNDTEATLELGNGAGNVVLDQAIVVRADADAADNDINAFIVSTDNDNTLSGNIAMDGELSINAANAAGSLTLDGSTLELKSQRLLVTGPGDVIINNTMSSTDTSGDLLKQGTGTVTLNAANTFSGDVFIDEGTVAVTAANPLASSAINMGALSGSANTRLHLDRSGSAMTVDQDINVRDTGGSKTIQVTGNNHALSGSIDLGGDFADDGGDLTLQVDSGASATIDGSGKTLNLWNETLTVQGEGDVNIGPNVTFKDEIGTGGDIDMDGSGTLTIDGTHAQFGGIINVNDGIVDLQGALDNADGAVVNDGGTLMGDGSISINTGSLTINNGGVLSPGNSVGTINAGDTVFAAGGSYLWEITDFEDGAEPNNGAVDAGTDWDLLAVTGTLDLNSLTTSNPFIIDITSLISAAGANGLANNFDPGTNFVFDIVQASGGILTNLLSNPLNDYFSISQANFSNDRRPAIFSVQITGGSLQLKHLAHVPEPSTTVLFGLGGILLFRARSRRKLTLS